MTEKLVAVRGYKLPGEQVWVTESDMYEVYSKIELTIPDNPLTQFIITKIVDEGLYIETLQ